MTFDYITAWRELARPAFEALPANVRALVDRVAVEANGLHQISDTSMPWPDEASEVSIAAYDGQTLRQVFDKIPAEVLALAARVVYSVGHWKPGNTPQFFDNSAGASWKFSHYADQVLRGRLELPERGDNGRDKAMIQTKVIEGAIRVCYSSPDSWTWEEVAPATVGGLESARRIGSSLRTRVDMAGGDERKGSRAYGDARENAAYKFMETLKSSKPLAQWPSWEKFGNLDPFMCSEHEMKRREAASRPPVDRETVIAKINADRDKKIADTTREETIEAAGKVWLVNHGLPIDNAIFYSHTGRWCFGWRTPLTPEDRSALLEHLSEFPYDYDLKGGQQEKCTKCGAVRLVTKEFNPVAGKCSSCDWVTQ